MNPDRPRFNSRLSTPDFQPTPDSLHLTPALPRIPKALIRQKWIDPIPQGASWSERRRLLQELIDLDDVAHLEIVIGRDSDAALVAIRHLGNVVLESN